MGRRKEEGVGSRGRGRRRNREEGREGGEGVGCQIDGVLGDVFALPLCLPLGFRRWGCPSRPQTSATKERPGSGHWESACVILSKVGAQ